MAWGVLEDYKLASVPGTTVLDEGNNHSMWPMLLFLIINLTLF
jgi:hypothetical protein